MPGFRLAGSCPPSSIRVRLGVQGSPGPSAPGVELSSTPPSLAKALALNAAAARSARAKTRNGRRIRWPPPVLTLIHRCRRRGSLVLAAGSGVGAGCEDGHGCPAPSVATELEER